MSTTSSVASSTTSTPLTSAPASPTLAAKDAPLNVLDAIESRRSYYALNKDLPIGTSRLHTIIETIATNAPTSFNSQTTRSIVLTGSSHDKFWDAVSSALRAKLSAEAYPSTATRLSTFQAAHGTVLFFVDPSGVKVLQDKMPTFAAGFPVWANEASAMQQFATWTALEAEGVGANLQHYGNLVEEVVKQEWNVPQEWQLMAQLVFGGKVAGVGEKSSLPVEKLVFWRD